MRELESVKQRNTLLQFLRTADMLGVSQSEESEGIDSDQNMDP